MIPEINYAVARDSIPLTGMYGCLSIFTSDDPHKSMILPPFLWITLVHKTAPRIAISLSLPPTLIRAQSHRPYQSETRGLQRVYAHVYCTLSAPCTLRMLLHAPPRRQPLRFPTTHRQPISTFKRLRASRYSSLPMVCSRIGYDVMANIATSHANGPVALFVAAGRSIPGTQMGDSTGFWVFLFRGHF